jgi:hypothetical protein
MMYLSDHKFIYKPNTHTNQTKPKMSKPVVLDVDAWVPDAIRFTPPKVNDKQGKSINIISSQTGRGLHVSSPLLTTWGISDFVDQTTGVSDGKFSISLTFPQDQYTTDKSNMFLDKIKAFEQAILAEAVKNSDLWWGEKLTLDILKYSFFPMLKFPKIKGTKKPDMTKSPTISAKVPFYEKDNKWNVELYDTSGKLIFPCENDELTPAHFVPKLSKVACVLQCGGIWIGGKGWGVTWKLVQAVVKPKEVVSVFGKCHINLSEDDKEAIDDDASSVLSGGSADAAATVVDSDDDSSPRAKKSKVEVDSTPPAPPPTPTTPAVKVVVATNAVKASETIVDMDVSKEAPLKKKVIKKVAPK